MNHELAEILANAMNPRVPRKEVMARFRSWVIDGMLRRHPEWTREKAEAIYDKAAGA